ncbi:unnamed protein product, partial [Mycena citricolor]
RAGVRSGQPACGGHLDACARACHRRARGDAQACPATGVLDGRGNLQGGQTQNGERNRRKRGAVGLLRE